MILDQKINRLFHKMENLEVWFVKHVPDKKLPLVNSKGFSEKAKSLLEKRLKGKPHGC